MLEALDSAGHLHEEPAPPVHFSYSRKEHGALQRLVIRLIERLTGQSSRSNLAIRRRDNARFSRRTKNMNLSLDVYIQNYALDIVVEMTHIRIQKDNDYGKSYRPHLSRRRQGPRIL
ncbi:MAG TPA: hypothetical protein VM144_18435 [Aestuariivirga sp.]|nr:hypothetical protein [Aestuariivirga sp.]